MPRKHTIYSNEHYYHVTARSNNKEFFYLPIDVIWELMQDELRKLQNDYHIQIAAFVLMNNHFHLLIQTPQISIDKIMYFFMKRTTLEIQKRSMRINKIYGGRYKASIILNQSYLVNVYKYIYQNPIRANLCRCVGDYPYSTLHIFKKVNPGLIAKHINAFLPMPMNEIDILNWLNERFDQVEEISIKKGIKKTTFKYTKNPSNNKTILPQIKMPSI